LKRLTIQARLTLWFFLSLAVIVALFVGASWLAMKASMYHSIDRDLRYRIGMVVPFIQLETLNTQERFAKEFANPSEEPIVGVLVQITGEQQEVLYESDVLRSHHVAALPAGPADGSVSITTGGTDGWPVRVASRRVVAGGIPLTVHVVEPLRDLLTSLREYSFYLALLVPAVLLVATTAGYWLSRRALAPVEQIRKEADTIDPADLAARLRVPHTEDELARLARTLNAMLSRIEAAFRSIQQFTADASHELRAPLALIVTAGEVSLRRERSREELTETLNKIVREARQMSRLVENLLSLARGDIQRAGASMADVDLGEMLRDLAEELTPSADAKGLKLVWTVADGEILVNGDSTELRRLFVILLDNAIKYTETGSITLSVRPAYEQKSVRGGPMSGEETMVKVTVADTGIGIDAASLPHVFDRFWRADKVRSRAEGGAGLGLSLASQIVQNHGGSISVESELGRGSVFTVRLKGREAIEGSPGAEED
jgi:heavy metal sensor kinase